MINASNIMRIMRQLLILLVLANAVVIYAQNNNPVGVGINTNNPTNTLDVNGTMRIRSIVKPVTYNGENILTTDSKGVLRATSKEDIVPSLDMIGSLISNGKNFLIAQEIAALMTGDFTINKTNSPEIINPVNKKLVDNENKLNNGVFSVVERGIYNIKINVQINASSKTSDPILGVWDDTAGKWIARVKDSYTAPVTANGMQTYTLMATVELLPGVNYSFRTAISNGTATIKAQSSGSTGTGDSSFFSIKRVS
ncbi:MAG: hypothetical protein FDW93_04105 [Bergeyella sp.]|nr:hypothetical protein [Bergeyella sp.]